LLTRIDAQELAQQLAEPAGVVVYVAGSAAIPGRDVEEAVRPELQLAAVVVVLARVGDDQDLASRPDRGLDQGTRVPLELVDLDVAGGVRVADVEAARLPVVGREGDREQPALPRG
jgi:hypothetical protein